MSALFPWLSVLAIGVGAFAVGMHFQREERKHREIRMRQMAQRASATARQGSAAQAMNPEVMLPGLGRIQDQQVPPKYKN
jgi:hypothetical protein